MVYVVWPVWVERLWVRLYSSVFRVLNLFQIKSKFEEKINIQTEENEVVLGEDF